MIYDDELCEWLTDEEHVKYLEAKVNRYREEIENMISYLEDGDTKFEREYTCRLKELLIWHPFLDE